MLPFEPAGSHACPRMPFSRLSRQFCEVAGQKWIEISKEGVITSNAPRSLVIRPRQDDPEVILCAFDRPLSNGLLSHSSVKLQRLGSSQNFKCISRKV